MKNLALENYGVVEMNLSEKEKENGGRNWTPIGIAVAIAISAINNWGDIREGFHDGLAGTPRH